MWMGVLRLSAAIHDAKAPDVRSPVRDAVKDAA
jgi:hypothetical protein